MRRRLAAVAFALAVGAAVMAMAGDSPLEAYAALARGAAGDSTALFRTLARATPLLLSGLAVALALRAGLFNIGAEGQLLCGALAAGWVGFALPPLPAAVHLPLALLAGAAAGGAWGFVPGLLRAWRGTHEVIVTIMMNYIAILLTHYLVNDVLRDPSSLAIATPFVRPAARLPAVGGNSNLSAGFGIALAMAVAVSLLVRRTPFGLGTRAVGLNAEAARTAGIRVGPLMVAAMTLSGALAGLAGAVEVLGVHRRFLDAFSPGYGFDSIAVALLGNLGSAGVCLSALLFGALGAGAPYMEALSHVPRQLVGVVQAVVILAVGARYVGRRG
ncbi:MAG: ABC transporter permease [Chthonomonadales bacterium]|nr:ABC transporter permease [Chthonomonadales bacterium]